MWCEILAVFGVNFTINFKAQNIVIVIVKNYAVPYYKELNAPDLSFFMYALEKIPSVWFQAN